MQKLQIFSQFVHLSAKTFVFISFAAKKIQFIFEDTKKGSSNRATPKMLLIIVFNLFLIQGRIFSVVYVKISVLPNRAIPTESQ